MNRIWFSLAFITNGVIMKAILAGFKNVNFDSNMVAFAVSMAIAIPFTLIAYFIFKKRLQYLNSELSNFQLGAFVLMPIFWFLWIILYFQGMFPNFGTKKTLEPQNDLNSKGSK